jgi:putative spermidine/putrescine transport system ATP-binding protein
VGSPQQIYNAPATRFVANFVGAANVLDGDVAQRLTGRRSAMLRPERVRLGAADGARASGAVREVQYFGAFTRLRVDVAGAQLQADLPEAPGSRWPVPGEAVHLHWDAGAVHALDMERVA